MHPPRSLMIAAGVLLFGCEHAPWSHFSGHRPPTLSLAEAMQAAERSTGGRAMSGELEREHGRSIYEIALVEAGGAILEVEIDGDTGEVVEIELADVD